MKKSPLVYSFIDKVCYDYDIIKSGDRILVGASGGKDSTLLIQYLANRKRRPDADFEFKALNIQSDFAPPFPEGILEMFKEWNVDYESIDVDVIGRLKPGRKMNCWWCSTQRRKELLHYAMEHGYNKIALGHHMDDVLETVLMNMMRKGELSTMPPVLKYENYPGVEVIRPLYYLSEEAIIQAAKDGNYYGFTCTCNYQNNSERKHARRLLEQLCEGDEERKRRIFNSLKNIKSEYLP